MEKITEYLNSADGSAEIIRLNRDDLLLSSDCRRDDIRNAFRVPDLPCSAYEAVAFGAGNEKDKITRAYSSSLQALVIFGTVSERRPIRIRGTNYVKAFFEYRNRVIGYPSSVDVVLRSENGEKLLFIESKLYELVRDSKPEGEKVIGPSYFSDDKNSLRKLGLEYSDLKNIGIDFYGGSVTEDLLYRLGGTPFKQTVARDGNEKAYDAVNPLPGNRYVYSYGIKQLLAHVIGILNLHEPGNNCSRELKNETPAETEFLCAYNELPGYEEEDAQRKLADYIAHYNRVKEILNGKKTGVRVGEMLSYQELCRENPGFFRDMDTVKKYYKL